MRPHPRIRKTVKWGGLMTTILLATVWISNAWWILWWAGRTSASGYGVQIEEGQVAGWFTQPPFREEDPPFSVERLPWASKTWYWWFLINTSPGPSCTVWVYVAIPLWAFAVPPALASAIAWRLDARARRRGRRQGCPACGYDRRGLGIDAVCPECGAAAAPAPPAPPAPQRT